MGSRHQKGNFKVRLIREIVEQDIQTIEEAAADGKKNLYISGIFLQANLQNKNGRVYATSILEREVNRYIKEKIEGRNAFGELGHPDSPSVIPERISHRIVELKRDGDNWLGKALVTNTPMGNIVRGIIEAGGRWGISSRGLGTLRKDEKTGVQWVNDDYRLLVAGDCVVDPSAPDAWLNGIMESVEWFLDESSGKWNSRVVEQTREKLKSMSSNAIKDNKSKLFERFIQQLSEPSHGDQLAALAKRTKVSEARVLELWQREIRDGADKTTAVANIKRKLGL